MYFFVLFLIVIILAATAVAAVNALLMRKYRKWAKAQAQIVDIEWSKRIGTRGVFGALFQPHIFDVSYKYSYNGQDYTGSTIIDFKPQNNALNLYINPQNPQETYVYK
ncbi:MAG: DUF3592 domain-containing protein [Elusimicrobiota bacterium]|jgi:hypothetical protein|nr:DUF3592 domain-containing protein [Elusimicrobiota bacterium]